jgi:hypothetical protein
MDVFRDEDLGPKIQLTSLDEITGLMFEHRIIISDRDKLVVAESLRVGNVGEIWISLLAVFTDDEGFVDL